MATCVDERSSRYASATAERCRGGSRCIALSTRSIRSCCSACHSGPLPASSGRIDRHRLNRGGNRQLNRIIHYVALTQISRSPEGRAYYERKRAEGKTTKEALRCLKRRISDRIYLTLRASALT